MIEFIGIDLDGTLLNSQKKVPLMNSKAIEEMERSGIMVTIFTGRSWIAAKGYLSNISSDIPAVFQNGAYIATTGSDKALRKLVLDRKSAVEVIEKARKYGVFAILFTNFTDTPDMIYEGQLPLKSSYMPYFERNSYRLFKVEDMAKCVSEYVCEIALVGSLEKIKRIPPELKSKNFTMILNTMIKDEAFVEFFGKGCGKETAMEFLLEKFDIDAKNAAFIGDSYNDLEVLKKIGHPIVMGNAPDELKKIASFVTATNDEDGVAFATYNYILRSE